MSARASFAFVAVLFLLTSNPGVRGGRADEMPQGGADPAPEQVPASEPEVPAKYQLAYKFRADQIVRYEFSQESEITTSVSGETETAKNSTRAKRHYKVTVVDDETQSGDLELTIDWVHMVVSFENGNSDPEPIEFQSDDPDKQPEKYRQILDNVGKPRAAIRFDHTGKPTKVLWGAPAQGAAAPGASGQTNPSAPVSVVDATPETYFLPLPDHPVAIGESWKERFDILTKDEQKNFVRIAMQRGYKLTAVKDGRATIEFRTAILTPVKNPAVAGQLIQREIAGKMVLDIERGLVLSRESGVENTVVNPFGIKSSMYAKSTYRERLLEDDAATTDKSSAPEAAATAKK